jgi:hypothetical protein
MLSRLKAAMTSEMEVCCLFEIPEILSAWMGWFVPSALSACTLFCLDKAGTL